MKNQMAGKSAIQINERRYKMKKVLIGIVLMALLAVPFVVAQETEQVGTTPDSALYGLKLGWEKFKLAFTMNQEKKAAKELELAQKRLAEANVMAERGNLKGLERAQAEHDRLLERAQQRISKLDGADNAEKAKEAIGKLVGLQRAIEVHEGNIERLKDIASSGNLTEEQLAKVNEMIAKMEDNTAKLKETEEKKKDNFKVKIKAVTNQSNDEIDEIVEDIEKGQGLEAARKIVSGNRIAQTEDAIAKLKERMENVKEKGLNVSYFKEQVALAESNLAEAKALYESGNYTEALQILKPVSNFGRNLNVVVRKMKEAAKQERVAELVKEAEEKNIAIKEAIKEKVKEIKEKAAAKQTKGRGAMPEEE